MVTQLRYIHYNSLDKELSIMKEATMGGLVIVLRWNNIDEIEENAEDDRIIARNFRDGRVLSFPLKYFAVIKRRPVE